MSNLSYCRFQNTLEDLVDCLDALRDGAMRRVDNEDEREAMLDLILVCRDIADEFGEY